MQKIDPEKYQERLEKITDLFSGFVLHARKQSMSRCPYRNRFDQCTAKFDCGNQIPTKSQQALPKCSGLIDYCNAWKKDTGTADAPDLGSCNP
ncbi:MAG: hypothetical protein DF168_00924 [Candidatus Moanabacter tarae]|uniref:Uncharacterized protein n=1 Tax=Candidatus Moanibacter tarae TaxID=2200854 RepID=A0A2Z4ALE1_9BACT|nr:MAG: hypothetical protein DF168_00924 [Candidatus Moanabacter tarae]|tara:strand:+ start:4409 stop:4687 length:279 start_codon:yes stop_codon:yes gene_type:complete